MKCGRLALALSVFLVASPAVRAGDLESVSAAERWGTQVAQVSLPQSLDALRRAGPLSIGGKDWNLGMAADAEFKYFFMTITGPSGTKLDALPRPLDFLGNGVTLELPGGGSILAKVSLCFTDPVHSSKIEFQPASGGKSLTVTTGGLLELLGRQATSLDLGGNHYHLAYLTDVDPATAGPTGTRSLLIVKDGRFVLKSWRLPAAELPVDSRVSVSLGDEELVLLKDSAGLLRLFTR